MDLEINIGTQIAQVRNEPPRQSQDLAGLLWARQSLRQKLVYFEYSREASRAGAGVVPLLAVQAGFL